jgi:hypothetical protein
MSEKQGELRPLFIEELDQVIGGAEAQAGAAAAGAGANCTGGGCIPTMQFREDGGTTRGLGEGGGTTRGLFEEGGSSTHMMLEEGGGLPPFSR